MLSKRGRTLSDEGVELFLDGMAVPPSSPCKNKIRKFLFSCFHSDWDDKIEKVTKSCRLSTMAMYGELWEDPENLKALPTSLDAGITNTVKLILSNDEGKVTKGSILKNYRFFLSIMEAAFKNNDHQTAMMMWLALTHSSVERLEFKRPKKAEKILQNVIDSYGTSNNCYDRASETSIFSYQYHVVTFRHVQNMGIRLYLLIFYNLLVLVLDYEFFSFHHVVLSYVIKYLHKQFLLCLLTIFLFSFPHR